MAEDVPTEILRYDLRSKMYQQLQFLPTKGATDLCFLNIGTGLNTIHFLVVVNQLAFSKQNAVWRLKHILLEFLTIDSTGAPNNNAISHVYKFVGEKFEPFQSIQLNSKKAGCLTYQVNQVWVKCIMELLLSINSFRWKTINQLSCFPCRGVRKFTNTTDGVS